MPLWTVDKPPGWTPLEALRALQTQLQLPDPLTYAGRLDPMATGVLLVLGAPENRNKEAYLHLDKVYQASFALGITSNSLDVLGEVVSGRPPQHVPSLASLVGNRERPVPLWSSVSSGGRSLVRQLRENQNATNMIRPIRAMHITRITQQRAVWTTTETLKDEACARIQAVQGDFRQQHAILSWQNLPSQPVLRIDAKIACAGGSYIRTLAEELGSTCQSVGLLWSLRRLSVGDHLLTGCVSLTRDRTI